MISGFFRLLWEIFKLGLFVFVGLPIIFMLLLLILFI